MSTGLYAGLVEEVKRYGLNDTTPEEVFTSSLPVEYVVVLSHSYLADALTNDPLVGNNNKAG